MGVEMEYSDILVLSYSSVDKVSCVICHGGPANM